MAQHYWGKSTANVVKIRAGFTPLKKMACTVTNRVVNNIRETVKEKAGIRKMVFGGFRKCLYEVQKFDSDTERVFALILERESLKWFKPVSGQFAIYYLEGAEHHEYMPDFIVELDDKVVMVEIKARADINDSLVLEKKQAAEEWCRHALAT